MEDVLFSMKRAYHGSLRVSREMLKPYGLTPARFDMMRAIAECECGLTQSDLRRQLGVSAPTVSRMLRALEERELVWRRPAFVRKKEKRVYLTQTGATLILRALTELAEAFALVVRSVVTATWFCIGSADAEVATFSAWLHRIRDALCERARLDRIPWLSGLTWRWERRVKPRRRNAAAAITP